MAPYEIRVQVQHILILITNRLLPGDSKGFPNHSIPPESHL